MTDRDSGISYCFSAAGSSKYTAGMIPAPLFVMNHKVLSFIAGPVFLFLFPVQSTCTAGSKRDAKNSLRDFKKRLVICPERDIIIEDLDVLALRCSCPDFSPVTISRCSSTAQ